MCGIFAYSGSSNATKIVFDGLKNLEYRGYDSWGIALVHNQKIQIEKHVGKIGQADLTLGESHLAFGHTRWATHGGVTKSNAHPHLSCDGKIAVVHNGVVDNYQKLKNELVNHGHKFISTTDTEVIAHLLERGLENVKKIKGLNTIVVLELTTNSLYAYRNGSPLVVGKGLDGYYLSSDIPSLLDYTREISVLEDGQVVRIKGGKLLTKLSFHKDHTSSVKYDKGHYSSFLIKEIHDQPQMLRNLAEYNLDSVKKVASLLKSSHKIYALGCGSAYYAMLSFSYMASRVGIQVHPLVADEFTSFSKFIEKGDLVICASQSGETIDLVNSARLAKKNGAIILSLVNVISSTLARESDITLPLLAGSERAVVSTKAFTAKLALCYLLLSVVGDNGKESLGKLLQASILLESFISPSLFNKMARLASSIKNKKSILILGKGENFPVAMEGSMKIKEVSYIHAEGFPAGELKHGVIALVEKETPVVVIATKGNLYEDTITAAEEVKARGARVIGIGSQKEPCYDVFIKVPEMKHLQNLLNVVPLQILGYSLAQELGRDVDMPRNLAKSVTVK